ncbi:MAG: caspase family protein [Pseudomonadota bacterium]|jgi:hypothetical protein
MIRLFGCVVAALAMLVVPASAQERVALVVGNGAYVNAKALPNPTNDADDMAAVLRELGFTVVTGSNTNKVEFDQKVRDFARAVRTAKVAAFFYAGHGMQVAGKNYAIPIDAKLEGAADLPVETVDIDQIVSIMESDPNRVNLVFLDACRDNPLTRTFARNLPATRAANVGSGLNAIEAGRGTMIAFSTAPNKVALDGQGRNSPFTTALLKHIRTPGLDIAFVMRRVTADVEKSSGGTQVPWVHASLISDVTLAAGDSKAANQIPPPPSPAPGPSADEVAWNFVKGSESVDELRRFKSTFPASRFRVEADTRIAALETMQRNKPPPAINQGASGGRIPLASLSATPTQLGQYGDLKAYTVLRDGARECYVIVPASAGRGWDGPVMMISNRPARKIRNELSFAQLGFRDKSSLTLHVKSSEFPMLAQSDAAWTKNRDDESVVTAMRSSSEARLKGTGSNRKPVELTFPLRGLPDALERSARECLEN